MSALSRPPAIREETETGSVGINIPEEVPRPGHVLVVGKPGNRKAYPGGGELIGSLPKHPRLRYQARTRRQGGLGVGVAVLVTTGNFCVDSGGY